MLNIMEDVYTKRFKLRELLTEDSKRIFPILNDEEIIKTLNIELNKDIYDTKALINKYREGIKKNTKLPYAIIDIDTGKKLGVVIVKLDLYNEDAYEYTMFLAKEYWGRGICSEVLQAVLDIAFNKVKTKNFRGYVMKNNIPSSKALEKNGFTLEKTFRVDGIEEEIISYLYTKNMYINNKFIKSKE